MTDGRTNENEGSDPSSAIEKQNRADKGDKGTGESRAGAGEGDDADPGDSRG